LSSPSIRIGRAIEAREEMNIFRGKGANAKMELTHLFTKYPELESCAGAIAQAFEILKGTYRSGGKALICGNGGSASDSEHIVGELMKGFRSKRPIAPEDRDRLIHYYPNEGAFLADHLQGALPAISLTSHTALVSAYTNDVSPEMAFAQQVYGYGKPGDTLIGLSTSGNSANVVRAAQVAKAMGMRTIGFSGRDGGRLKGICDVTIQVPWDETPQIQERHLPVYHTLCILLEREFFGP